jgi:hypothetical protein
MTTPMDILSRPPAIAGALVRADTRWADKHDQLPLDPEHVAALAAAIADDYRVGLAQIRGQFGAVIVALFGAWEPDGDPREQAAAAIAEVHRMRRELRLLRTDSKEAG